MSLNKLSSQKGIVPIIMLAIIGVLFAGGAFVVGRQSSQSPSSVSELSKQESNPLTQIISKITSSEQSDPGSLLTSHTPVDLHALPLGDKRISTSAKKGYIYSCRTQSDEQGGAGVVGPWINQSAKTYDKTAKPTVNGTVKWSNTKWTISTTGDKRLLTGNGLPAHITGIYPIQSTDDAYQYDRNPNSIKEQTLTISLPIKPTELDTPDCVGGEVGIMLSGIPLFNGFDAGSRDANAYEIQDDCSGHPQVSGLYHYHGLSECLNEDSSGSEHSKLLGYAFDGFGIYGPKSEDGKEVSTADLDECHGHTHDIVWDGANKRMFHYHMTYDFPYSVGCFRGNKAVNGPLGGSTGGGAQGPAGMQQPEGMMRPPMNGGNFPPPPR
jgi:hypothetical protein